MEIDRADVWEKEGGNKRGHKVLILMYSWLNKKEEGRIKEQ